MSREESEAKGMNPKCAAVPDPNSEGAKARTKAEARVPKSEEPGDRTETVNPSRLTEQPNAKGINPQITSDTVTAKSKTSDDSACWSWGDEDGEFALKEDSKPVLQDLGERTAVFGEAIIDFAKKIPFGPVNNRLIEQLVGAGTSIGANFCEADDAVSGREFKQRIGICRKESKETMFFLRMIASSQPELAAQARALWREAKELNLIFGAIWRK